MAMATLTIWAAKKTYLVNHRVHGIQDGAQ